MPPWAYVAFGVVIIGVFWYAIFSVNREANEQAEKQKEEFKRKK